MSQATPSLTLRPLSRTFGAEVIGIDLSSDLSAHTRQLLNDALLAHQVLLFRGQELDADQQVRFANGFGKLRRAEQNRQFPCDNAYAHYVANIDIDGRPTHVHPNPDSAFWHSDGSWSHSLPKATVLQAIRVPRSGGETLFADMCSVFDQLPPSSRQRVVRLRAIHDVQLSRASRDQRWPWQWQLNRDDWRSLGSRLRWAARVVLRGVLNRYVVHPVVLRHPETGRRSLFIGDHAWRIEGMFWPTGIREMRKLNEIKITPDQTYSHRWQTGDLLVWDNRSVLHKSGHYDISNDVRVLRRCVILGAGEATRARHAQI